MAFEIVADDFVGKDIPLTDKLNALYFTLGEAYAIAVDALDVQDPRIDTILMAKSWSDLLIDAIEDLETKNPTAYNYIEENTSNDFNDLDIDEGKAAYIQWLQDEEDGVYEDDDEDFDEWGYEEYPPDATELLGSDE